MGHYFLAPALPPLDLHLVKFHNRSVEGTDQHPEIALGNPSLPNKSPTKETFHQHTQPETNHSLESLTSPFSLDDLWFFLQNNLSQSQMRQVFVLRFIEDLYNIRALYQNVPINFMGNFTEKELEEALLVGSDLPEYVFAFLSQFSTTSDRLAHFRSLISTYYDREMKESKGALKEILEFERTLRLVLAWFRIKESNRPFSALQEELQFENFDDPLVIGLLSSNPEQALPKHFATLLETLLLFPENPWEQYKVVTLFRLKEIEKMCLDSLFSFDWVLSYVAQFLILESYRRLDEKRGRARLIACGKQLETMEQDE